MEFEYICIEDDFSRISLDQLDIFMCLTLLVDGVLLMDVGLTIFEVADKVEEDCVAAFEVEDWAAEVESAEDEPDET